MEDVARLAAVARCSHSVQQRVLQAGSQPAVSGAASGFPGRLPILEAQLLSGKRRGPPPRLCCDPADSQYERGNPPFHKTSTRVRHNLFTPGATLVETAENGRRLGGTGGHHRQDPVRRESLTTDVDGSPDIQGDHRSYVDDRACEMRSEMIIRSTAESADVDSGRSILRPRRFLVAPSHEGERQRHDPENARDHNSDRLPIPIHSDDPTGLTRPVSGCAQPSTVACRYLKQP